MPRSARRSIPRRPPYRGAAKLSGRRAAVILVLLALAFACVVIAGGVGAGLPQATWAAVSVLLLVAALALSLPPLVGALRQSWRQRRNGPTGTQVRITAAGLPFLAALVILIVAAVNSGNNLIYLVVAALLGALVTSGIFSAVNLTGLTLDLEWPEHAFAGRPAPVGLRLGNQKRLLPSYSLRLAATSEAIPDAAGGHGPAGAEAAMHAAYFAYLPARRQAAAASTITFPRRGRYTAAAFVLSSRFPFGLLDKRRRFRPAADDQAGPILLVYPQITPAAEQLAETTAAGAVTAAPEPGGSGQDLYRLRPHTAGDSLRRVYWRASAKTGVLQVREFSREQDQRLRVLLALEPGGATPEQMERAISLCASLLWAAAEGEDWVEFTGANAAPGMAAGGGAAAPPPPGRGLPPGRAWTPPPMPAAEAAHAVLRYLALVECGLPLAPFSLPGLAGEDGGRLFLAHRGQAPDLPATAQAVFAAEL